MAQDEGTRQMGQRRNLKAECPDVDALGASQEPLGQPRACTPGLWSSGGVRVRAGGGAGRITSLSVIADPREMDRLWVPQNRAPCISSHICTYLGQGALCRLKATGRSLDMRSPEVCHLLCDLRQVT